LVHIDGNSVGKCSTFLLENYRELLIVLIHTSGIFVGKWSPFLSENYMELLIVSIYRPIESPI
jgi:hypothetical protein